MRISATPPGLLPVQSKRLANRRERTGIDRDSKMNLWHQPLTRSFADFLGCNF